MNDIKDLNKIDFKIRTFGNLISNLRKTLNLTQENFGKLIMISRITAIKIEKIEDVKELSDDLLFRLNHLSFRLMNNETFDNLVKFCAEKVYDITYATLSERMINNMDSPVLKLII